MFVLAGNNYSQKLYRLWRRFWKLLGPVQPQFGGILAVSDSRGLFSGRVTFCSLRNASANLFAMLLEIRIPIGFGRQQYLSLVFFDRRASRSVLEAADEDDTACCLTR